MSTPATSSASTCSARVEACFFGREESLAGVWRTPRHASAFSRVWLFCPPWGEEDKSARRALTEAAQFLVERGDAVLLFNYRGAGDSRGDFGAQRLDAWRDDIRDAITEIQKRAPEAKLCLLGVRLGASLLAQVVAEDQTACEQLTLIEPILSGKRALNEMLMRQKLRNAITQNDSAQNGATSSANASASTCEADESVFDLDGWPLSTEMRADLNALDLSDLQIADAAISVQVFQVGAKNEVAPPLSKWCQSRNWKARALVSQPFWNLLDHAPTFDLWREVFGAQSSATSPASTCSEEELAPRLNDGALILHNDAGEALVGTWHQAAVPARATVVMLHGWSGYRCGPHQMLARAANQLNAAGCHVLRFDFSGRGDSDGDAVLSTLATMSRDARTVLNWCRAQTDTPILLLGMCSGCEVVLGAIDDDIAGVALWSAPIFAATSSAARDNRKRARHLATYARKLLQISTYRRLLRGEVNTRAVSKVVSSKGGESKNVESDEPGQLPRGWRDNALARFSNWNKRRAPLLLVYGSADPTTTEALAWYRNLAPHATTHLVEGANHSYYGLAWEREVIARTVKWLDETV